MSARRSTRSASKAASARGASPAHSELATPSRRSSSRAAATKAATKTSGAFPTVNAKQSTAYGTNTTSGPGALINTKETRASTVFQTILEADEAREEEMEATGETNSMTRLFTFLISDEVYLTIP